MLYHAQRRHGLAMAGAYARIRHPQYVAFVLILLGFLLQWPTLLIVGGRQAPIDGSAVTRAA